MEALRKSLKQHRRSRKQASNCWLCEGWNEAAIEYSQVKLNEPVYLHIECDDYKPDMMYTERM
jgi:hypothetical protein